MTEKMIAALALAVFGGLDTAGMILLSCMEKTVPPVLTDSLMMIVGGLVVLAGVNGVRNGIKKINGGS